MGNKNEFFSERMMKEKKITVKNINVTAFAEQLSLTLFSKLYCLNMKILGYWWINITVIYQGA